MAKGGVRIVSAKKAIAKGMGIPIFINVLKEINRIGGWVSIEEVHHSLVFGGSRTETCRSYFKECWRFEFTDCQQNGKAVECTAENWSKGGQKTYKINSKGITFLAIPDSLKSIALGWYIVNLDDKNKFEQLYKTFKILKHKNLPLNYFKASKLTGVVRDSIKAIMYGWLEPLGFLERVSNGSEFCLDKAYYDFLKKQPSVQSAIPKVINKHIRTNDLLIKTRKRLNPFAPDITPRLDIPIYIENLSNRKINIKCSVYIYPIFNKRFSIGTSILEQSLESKRMTVINVEIISNKQPVSESFDYTQLGELDISGVSAALPDILLTTSSDLHEAMLAKLLTDIGLDVSRFSKSDRPDMVLSFTREEKDLEKFLHNDELKILVETTSVVTLGLNKVLDDLKNFKNHTTKVLKINAQRTLIVGVKISPQIYSEIDSLKKMYHPFTIINFRNLELLKEKIVKYKKPCMEKIKSIVCSDGIIEEKNIVDVFKE